MIKFIDVTGKTEDEAIQSALAQLKMDRDDVSVEILERAKAGFLGIGSAPARVRVSYDDGKAEEVKPVEKPAAPKPEKKVEPASAPKAVPMYAPEVLQKKESRANDKPRTERGDRPAREDRRENRAPPHIKLLSFEHLVTVCPFKILHIRKVPMLEPGGINHSESNRIDQFKLIRNSQCTNLSNCLLSLIQQDH